MSTLQVNDVTHPLPGFKANKDILFFNKGNHMLKNR